MKPLDYAKALGVALLLMAANVAVSFAVVWAYSAFIAPGHEPDFYQAAAQRIAPWSSIVAGAVLFFLAGWVFTRRRPERNGLAFAGAFAAIYIAADVAIMAAAGALIAMGAVVALSMASKLIAALAGAYLAQRGA